MLVISAPESWTAGAVAELVSGAGGDVVSVEPCTIHDLIDQPTRSGVGTPVLSAERVSTDR